MTYPLCHRPGSPGDPFVSSRGRGGWPIASSQARHLREPKYWNHPAVLRFRARIRARFPDIDDDRLDSMCRHHVPPRKVYGRDHSGIDEFLRDVTEAAISSIAWHFNGGLERDLNELRSSLEAEYRFGHENAIKNQQRALAQKLFDEPGPNDLDLRYTCERDDTRKLHCVRAHKWFGNHSEGSCSEPGVFLVSDNFGNFRLFCIAHFEERYGGDVTVAEFPGS